MITDWKMIFDTLGLIVVLSIFIERALSIVFENKYLITKFDGKKEIVAFFVSFIVCYCWDFDAISLIVGAKKEGIGYFLTAAIIAGGAKGSVKLFRDILDFRSTAVDQVLSQQNKVG